MKKGIRIVNCARGELIVDEALVEGLKSGQIGGAALDVFRQEPLKDSPYYSMDNVLLSPHIAGATDEAQEAIGIQLAHQVRDYLKLGVVQNAVNLPSLSHEEYAEGRTPTLRWRSVSATSSRTQRRAISKTSRSPTPAASRKVRPS